MRLFSSRERKRYLRGVLQRTTLRLLAGGRIAAHVGALVVVLEAAVALLAHAVAAVLHQLVAAESPVGLDEAVLLVVVAVDDQLQLVRDLHLRAGAELQVVRLVAAWKQAGQS